MTNQRNIAAIFDVDGTLIAGTSMEEIFLRFLWRRKEIGLRGILGAIDGAVNAIAAGQSPINANKGYLRGKECATIGQLARECFESEISHRVSPRAIDRLHWHQDAGHFVLLLSGALDVLLEPLAESLGVSARIGVQLEACNRRFSGRINGIHPYGMRKADCLTAVARATAFDLKKSFAYANHYTDRFLLAMVGNPVAINADPRLHRFAAERGWMIDQFSPRQKKEVYG
jgi:HAD superfamily hydrolase (TIGR01490 family)